MLPKPFTKEGLLSMLEKHLSHLKRQPPGMHAMAPPDALNSAKRSMKSEDSPATSPATVSNWNSPGGFAAHSPASNQPDDPYMQAMHNTTGPAPYPMQSPMPPHMYNPGQPPHMQGQPRQGPPPGPQGPPQQHRRGISDISGGVDLMAPDAKRQQMYGPGPPMQMPQPLPPHMQRPPGR